MKQQVMTVLTMLAAFLIQTTLLQHFRILGALPNLTLILIVVFSIQFEKPVGIYAALAGGILQDFFFGQAFGLFTLIYLTVALLADQIKDHFFKESDLTPVLMIFMATAYHYFLLMGVYYFAGKQFLLPAILLKLLAPELIYNGVVCWGVYRIFGRVISKYGIETSGR